MKKHDILLVDDDPGAIGAMRRALDEVAHVRFALNAADALRLARAAPPDLILLDAEMPEMSGFQLCELLKADADLADVPVIFVTSHGGTDFEVAGFELGAVDFVSKPVKPPQLLARVRAQLRSKQMADDLRRTSTIDALTGLPNRTSFDEALKREWLRGLRRGDPMTLLTIEVDHFDLFTGRYGQAAGDVCLRAVAHGLRGVALRPADLVARIGTDQFAMVLPQTERTGAEHIAHRVLDTIEALGLRHAQSPLSRHVTVTVGIGCYDEQSPWWVEPSAHSRFGGPAESAGSAASLLTAAGHALDAARNAGRAQARLLDIADHDIPAAVRDIRPSARQRRARRQRQSA